MFDKLPMLGQVFIFTIPKSDLLSTQRFTSMQPIRARLTSPEGWAKKDLWSAGNVLVAMSWQRKESGINCMDECMDEIIMQRSHKVFCPWSHGFDSLSPPHCDMPWFC